MNNQDYFISGKVYLVGAGPGDPDLITVKGARVLEKADIIVYDRLANPELLSITSDQSEHLYVGKRPDKPSVSQAQINHILITKAREGKVVARLKGGDPFVFGRGGEECESLRSENIPFEIVPGISSALAAPAFAGIPVTYRKVARSFTVVTGHTLKSADTFANWEHLVHADTLIVLMGMGTLPQIAETLIRYGRDAQTPISIIEKATYRSQKTVVGTLGTIAGKVESLSPPGTIVIGELAGKANQLAWFKPEEELENTVLNAERRTQFAG
jgi:uroporphyrin-III C-methyltransferase